MKSRQEFERKVHHNLNAMEARISYLNEGVKGLNDAVKEFREDMAE